MENSELYYTEPHQPHVWKRGEIKPIFIADTYYSAKLAASELNRLSRPVPNPVLHDLIPIAALRLVEEIITGGADDVMDCINNPDTDHNAETLIEDAIKRLAELRKQPLNLSRPVTDAEIDAMFPIDGYAQGYASHNYAQFIRREGAKALRDQLEGKG